ncbi:MAG: lysophospholipase [Pseudobutyrivibrio sp.]|nr:lysophospholipase [Pseudobutyrivibrio sp.]
MIFKDLTIYKEQDFAAAMEGKILPFLNSISKDGYFTGTSGRNFYYQAFINPKEKASIVICHGYCEFTTKYYETIYYFYQMGYSVFIMDQRGHGKSDREVSGYFKVHINHFEDYVTDFNDFIEKEVRAMSPTENLILFAHSMGGAVAALYLEKYPSVFRSAILSSPMIELATGGQNKLVVKLVCLLSYLPFMAKRYMFGHHDYDHTFKYPRCSAMSKARYSYQYNEREREVQYRTNGCTFGWAREALNVSKKILKKAKLIKIPVILMQASQDTLVVNKAQNDFADRVSSCRLLRFEGSKHEIFNASDDIIIDYYEALFSFLEKGL